MAKLAGLSNKFWLFYSLPMEIWQDLLLYGYRIETGMIPQKTKIDPILISGSLSQQIPNLK